MSELRTAIMFSLEPVKMDSEYRASTAGATDNFRREVSAEAKRPELDLGPILGRRDARTISRIRDPENGAIR